MIRFNPDERENSWYGLLNCSEATVLSPDEERALLVELVDCKKRILEGLSRTDESGSDKPMHHDDFQQLIRDLAESDVAISTDAAAAALKPLACRYQEVRAKLAMANVRLVAHIAKRYHDRGIPRGDLIQDGFCALLVAIDRFNVVNETRLATYAIWWIRQALQHAVAGGSLSRPVESPAAPPTCRAQVLTGASDFGRERTTRSHPAERTLSPAIERVFAATRPVLSLDAPSWLDDSATIGKYFVLDDSESDQDDSAHQVVNELIKTLGSREQVILKLRFGLGGEPPRTLIQVSKVLGVSKERVRQIQDRALEKLRSASSSDESRDRPQRVYLRQSLSARKS